VPSVQTGEYLMGMSYRTYVGPYLWCSVRTRPATKEIRLCARSECRFFRESSPMPSDSNFCPQCGTPAVDKIVEVEGQVEEILSSCDLMEATNENLVPVNNNYADAGVHLFVSNLAKAPGLRLERGGDLGEIMQYDGVIIDQELTAFRERHADDLEIVYEHYGEDRVEVRWGVLASYG